MTKRIQLAYVSFGKLEAMWRHQSSVAKAIRLMSYKAIVESVLLYNCGTWALSSTQADRLDRAQRKMIRKVLGLTWKNKITNERLYTMSSILPASVQVINARWRLFGHTLRMKDEGPAQKAMASYFTVPGDCRGRQGNACTIASVVSDDYKRAYGEKYVIKSMKDYEAIRLKAQDRVEWKNVVATVVNAYCTCKSEKETKRKEKREKKTVGEEEKESNVVSTSSKSNVGS